MFKNTKKFIGMDKEEKKEIKQLIGIGLAIWCVGAALYLSVICSAIYFIFWCAKHFNIIG